MSGLDTEGQLPADTQEPTGPVTLPQHALEGLRRAIVTGAMRPGEQVLQEEVAQSLGISVAPVREALRVLEQEGQVTYRPRRGYFVTELRIDDLREIYELRKLLEERAARHALPLLDDETLRRIQAAAAEGAVAAEVGDVASQLEANRRFHFSILDAPDQPHSMRLIRLLWDSTEAYRATYYNAAEERRASTEAHGRILEALCRQDADALVSELDHHRSRALQVLQKVLDPDRDQRLGRGQGRAAGKIVEF